MPGIVDIQIPKPRRTNVNLDNVVRTTMAPGPVYPLVIRALQPNDEVYCSLTDLMKTLPLNSTFLGSDLVRADAFFIPLRNYNQILHNDPRDFDDSQTYLPAQEFRINNLTANVINPSSLDYYLGCPQRLGRSSIDNQNASRWLNMVPKLGYWDVISNYYVNTQQSEVPFIRAYSSTTPTVQSVSLTRFNLLRKRILWYPGDEDPVSNQGVFGVHYNGDEVSGSENWIFLAPSLSVAPLGGLALCTYLNDRFTSFLSSEKYDLTLSRARVQTQTGYFDMDAFRRARDMNHSLQKELAAGSRFSDWERVHFGYTSRRLSEVPQFIASHSFNVTYEDVVQTSDSGGDGDPLGTLGGRGHGISGNRSFRFFAPGHGYLMIMYTIRPNVDYFQHIAFYLKHATYASLHNPDLDGIGMQDLLVDDFYSAGTLFDSTTSIPTYLSVGKQPYATEWRTEVNRVCGEFAEDDKLMYLVNARRYTSSSAGSNWSTYVNPSEWNYKFKDASLTSQNYWFQVRVTCRVKRAISKPRLPR